MQFISEGVLYIKLFSFYFFLPTVACNFIVLSQPHRHSPKCCFKPLIFMHLTKCAYTLPTNFNGILQSIGNRFVNLSIPHKPSNSSAQFYEYIDGYFVEMKIFAQKSWSKLLIKGRTWRLNDYFMLINC